MTSIFSYLPSLPYLPSPARKLLSKVPSQQSFTANTGILWSCIGTSTIIFLAWQYVDRDPSETFTSILSPLYSGIDFLVDRLIPDQDGSQQDPGHAGYRLDGRRVIPTYTSGTTSTQQREKLKVFMEHNFMFGLSDLTKRPWTILTSTFSHRTFRHFLVNVTAFLEFGRVLSLRVQPGILVALIGCCAVGGQLGFSAQQSGRRLRQGKSKYTEARSLGLSAVVQGMGVAVTCLMPWALASPMGVVKVPLWLATSAYLLYDLLSAGDVDSKVGHAAHLGGAATGFAFYWALLSNGIGVVPVQSLRQLVEGRIGGLKGNIDRASSLLEGFQDNDMLMRV